jgi:hypothetical protein
VVLAYRLLFRGEEKEGDLPPLAVNREQIRKQCLGEDHGHYRLDADILCTVDNSRPLDSRCGDQRVDN